MQRRFVKSDHSHHLVDVLDLQELKPRYSQLAEDTETDFCVVGGGITGLCIAYNLQKSGVHLRTCLNSFEVSETNLTCAHMYICMVRWLSQIW